MGGKVLPKPNPLIQAPQKEEDETNIWSQILAEMSSKTGANVQGSVVMLGNDKCGKTSLFNKMCKTERLAYSSALEYAFLNIQADLKDSSYAYQLGSAGATFGPSDSISLPVHMLGGSFEFVPLLKFAMPKDLMKCCFVLMASIVPVEDVLPSLENWYKVVVESINEYFTPEQIAAGKQSQLKYWKEYVEPLDTSRQVESEEQGPDVDPQMVDLEVNTLVENCGAPIVVVLSKCDLQIELNEDQYSKLLYHLRKFCQARGAALIYTSAKEDKNVQLLYKYLAHRVYGLPFTSSAYIVEKDSIFIPTGWESNQKIAILVEGLNDLAPPTSVVDDSRLQNKENIVTEEEEQMFLAKLATMANEPLTVSPKRDQSSISKHTLTPQSLNSSQVDSNSPIVNFFGNLMKSSKDSGRSPAGTATTDPLLFQKLLNPKPKKASNASLTGDQSPRGGLTAVSSTSVLSDQEMDDAQSDNSTSNVEDQNLAKDQNHENENGHTKIDE